MRLPLYPITLSIVIGGLVAARGQESSIPAIERALPPLSDLTFPADEREKLEARLLEYEDRVFYLAGEPYDADVAIFSKAARFALRNNEFYGKKDFLLPAKLLDIADKRYFERDADEPSASWLKEKGLVIRGYRSSIDDSVQPYGLEIPETLDLSKPVPLLVWLHGRGDKVTDLHFINRCLTKSQALGGKVPDQQDAIIVHPFGRQCIGYKHAGEIDVLEVIEAVKAEYNIDPDKIALAGFSMGGAGAWHIGAHYNDQFCAIHVGAGFAETARYQKITPETLPPDHEQTLWKAYDVPNYVRNFFNTPVFSYSGEIDKQIQSADIMAEAFAGEGAELKRIIGKGMGHKYDDQSVKEIWSWLKERWEKGRDPFPKKIELQTPTLRYGKMHWFTATGLLEHWKDSRASGEWNVETAKIVLKTTNITAFQINAPEDVDLSNYEIVINDFSLKADAPGFPISSLTIMQKPDGTWAWGEPGGITKTHRLQGPIDDAFLEKFIVVPPAKAAAVEKLDAWIDFEQRHFENRWIELMRGEVEVENPSAVNSKDLAEANLILWGTPQSNPLIAEIIDQLPIKWTADTLEIGGQKFDPKTHVPSFIYPNPLSPKRYIVINSGLTFREGHDYTNSQQNPKLPDWSVIDFTTNPDRLAPGKVAAVGFFSESWE